mgnify:CR=1 FL=1
MHLSGVFCFICILFSLSALGGPGNFDGIEGLVDSIRPLQIEYSAPQNRAETDAYAKKFVQSIREKAAAENLPLDQVIVYLHYVGNEVPDHLKWLVRTLEESKIKVGERGEITRWDKEWDDLWPLKRLRISEQVLASELLAVINEETSQVPGLPKFADEAFSTSYVKSVIQSRNLRLKKRLGMPNGLWSIVTPYLNHHTGITRPLFMQIRNLQSAAFFMTLTGAAAAIQINQRFPNDPNVNLMAGVVIAASWRFFFQYFKEAGNLRHQLSKFYNHQTGKTQPSFLWTLGSQLVDSITSSMTFQMALHRGMGNLTPEIIVNTLLTSFAGSFAKIPFVQFTGKMGEEIQKKTAHITDYVNIFIKQYQAWVASGVLQKNEEIEAKLEKTVTFLGQGFYQQAEKNIQEVLLLIPKDENKDSELIGQIQTVLAKIQNSLQENVRRSNRLWWTNTFIDFSFDLLKYGSLMEVASIDDMYFALGIGGVGFVYLKHMIAKTYIRNKSDILDMIQMDRIDPNTFEEAIRLVRAIENKRRFSKVLRYSFLRFCRYTGIQWILGQEKISLLNQRWFTVPLKLELIQKAIATFEKEANSVPKILIELREFAENNSQKSDPLLKVSEPVTKPSLPGVTYVRVALGKPRLTCMDLFRKTTLAH